MSSIILIVKDKGFNRLHCVIILDILNNSSKRIQLVDKHRLSSTLVAWKKENPALKLKILVFENTTLRLQYAVCRKGKSWLAWLRRLTSNWFNLRSSLSSRLRHSLNFGVTVETLNFWLNAGLDLRDKLSQVLTFTTLDAWFGFDHWLWIVKINLLSSWWEL